MLCELKDRRGDSWRGRKTTGGPRLTTVPVVALLDVGIVILVQRELDLGPVVEHGRKLGHLRVDPFFQVIQAGKHFVEAWRLR